MNLFRFLMLLNWVSALGNLAFYAWGSHEPASLAVGIFNMGVAIALQLSVNQHA